MKNLVTFITIFILANAALLAQDKVRFGLSGGAVISNIGGDDVENTDSRTGFRFGGLVDIPITEKLAIQPFVGFSIQGWKVDNDEFKNNYVVIEAKVDYEIVDGLSLQAGPLLGINIFNSFDGEEDIEGFSKTNVGALIGVQYEFTFGLFLNAQYDRGFTDLFEDFDVKNRNLSFSVGYFF